MRYVFWAGLNAEESMGFERLWEPVNVVNPSHRGPLSWNCEKSDVAATCGLLEVMGCWGAIRWRELEADRDGDGDGDAFRAWMKKSPCQQERLSQVQDILNNKSRISDRQKGQENNQ
jgi:hypothetical protein